MNVTVDHLLAKIGQLTILLEAAQTRIEDLERTLQRNENDRDPQRERTGT